MEFSFLVRGLVAGFMIAAPVGPVNVLCIRQTLNHGRRFGFVSGLGAALADALYGAVAVYGLQFISSLLFARQGWITVIGGLFIIFLGARTVLAKPPKRTLFPKKKKKNYTSSLVSTFLLTLTNPSTIISFGAIFAWLGLAAAGRGPGTPLLLTAGVFLGSAFWWLVLALSVGAFRKQVKESMVTVNRVSGIIIIAFGVVALVLAGR